VIFGDGVLRRFRDAVANGAVAAGDGAGINDQRRLKPFSADDRKGLPDIGPTVVCDGP